jgi:hypothetical protein
MIGIDDEIDVAAHRGPRTLRQLAGQRRLILRHFELANPLGAGRAMRTQYWVEVRDTDHRAAEGFAIEERVYRELRALGVPEADA